VSAAPKPTPPAIALRLRVGDEQVAIYGFPNDSPRGAAADEGPLTEAELVVAAALVTGASADEIAQARGTSPRTVANQIAAIHRKLRVDSRMSLLSACRFVT
jgi:DNA-binding NarL/FixJ family response regulator